MRVDGSQVGREIRCSACNEPLKGHGRSPCREEEPETRAPEADYWFLKLGKKLGAGDTTMLLDGAIGGALGGILSGIVVGSVAESIGHAADGEVFGGVLSGVILGFILGVVGGLVAGLLLAAWAPTFDWVVHLNPRRAALIGGTLSGLMVALILGGYKWLPAGALVGLVGAALWERVCAWAESYQAFLTTPSKEQHQWNEPDSDRWEIVGPSHADPRKHSWERRESDSPSYGRDFNRKPASSWGNR
jgi:hypothetical protein